MEQRKQRGKVYALNQINKYSRSRVWNNGSSVEKYMLWIREEMWTTFKVNIYVIKGTVIVISSDSQMEICPCPIHNNMGDIFFFLCLKVFYSNNFYMFSCSRNPQVTLVEKPQLKIISFPNFEHWYPNHTKVLRIPLWIWHFMEGSLKLPLQSV